MLLAVVYRNGKGKKAGKAGKKGGEQKSHGRAEKPFSPPAHQQPQAQANNKGGKGPRRRPSSQQENCVVPSSSPATTTTNSIPPPPPQPQLPSSYAWSSFQRSPDPKLIPLPPEIFKTAPSGLSEGDEDLFWDNDGPTGNTTTTTTTTIPPQPQDTEKLTQGLRSILKLG